MKEKVYKVIANATFIADATLKATSKQEALEKFLNSWNRQTNVNADLGRLTLKNVEIDNSEEPNTYEEDEIRYLNTDLW